MSYDCIILGKYRNMWQIPLGLKAWCSSSVYASLDVLKQEWSCKEWGGRRAIKNHATLLLQLPDNRKHCCIDTHSLTTNRKLRFHSLFSLELAPSRFDITVLLIPRRRGARLYTGLVSACSRYKIIRSKGRRAGKIGGLNTVVQRAVVVSGAVWCSAWWTLRPALDISIGQHRFIMSALWKLICMPFPLHVGTFSRLRLMCKTVVRRAPQSRKAPLSFVVPVHLLAGNSTPPTGRISFKYDVGDFTKICR